jgi:hypothetical protein
MIIELDKLTNSPLANQKFKGTKTMMMIMPSPLLIKGDKFTLLTITNQEAVPVLANFTTITTTFQ